MSTPPPTGATRRRFIAGAAATGAAASLPAGASAATKKRPAARKRRPRSADVLVVGAGFSGLAAARELVAKGKSVIVVEARDRVGGRVLNADIGGGEVVEVGGQWVGPTQDRVLAMGRELGVDTFPTFNEGNGLLLYEGRRATFSTKGPLGPVPPVPDGLVDAATVIQKLDSMAAEIPVDAPWKAKKAVEYDSQTFEQFKQANTTTKGGRFLIDLGFGSVFAAEPRDVSLLFSLFYCASAGNENTQGTFSRLLAIEGGAQERRYVGGTQALAIRAADQLGKRFAFRAPARRILQSPKGVQVVSDRDVFNARRVIVAIAPTLAGRIDYAPIMPPGRDQLTQRMPMGTVIKCLAVYDEPFWRKDGLAGYTNADTSPVGLTFDNSPPDGRPGILLGFIEGQKGRVWQQRTQDERRAAVLDNFAAFYGERARRPERYLDMSWSAEQWSRGCYEGYTAPGVLLDYGDQLRAPVGRIHWAGTETSDYWTGYIDGAVRAGERAAREVLAEI